MLVLASYVAQGPRRSFTVYTDTECAYWCSGATKVMPNTYLVVCDVEFLDHFDG
jgi:hypothetical protein